MRIKTYLFILLLSAFTGCKKNENEFAPLNPRTVLMYMGGDNNLYQETDDKIESLRKAYIKGMGRLLIYQDATGITPRLLEISADQNGKGIINVLKNYPESNSASALIFKQVLDDVKLEAPAPSYGLIFFSHASGWLPQRTLIRPYAVAQDKEDDLELRDFAAAIPDHFFDFMIFEACFMSGIEVMYQLKDKSDYIVASSAEILSPGFTPIYTQLLPMIFREKPDLTGFARTFFNHYNGLEGNYRSATISVINTAALPALKEWVKQHTNSTLSDININEIQHYDRYTDYRLFFDFEDYFMRVSTPDSHQKLNQLISNAVIYKAATPFFMPGYTGFEIKHFSGLTSYIPQPEFNYLNKEYQVLKWAEKEL